jgi:hypothetical protein
VPYKPSLPTSADRLREAAKARGRAIRRRRRVLVTVAAGLAVIGLGGGLAAALPSSHSATRVNVSGQPHSPSDSTGSTLTRRSGVTAHDATTKPPGPTGSVTSPPPPVCTSGQVSLRAQADKTTYAWDDPILLTVRLSLVGTTPCAVERSVSAAWHGKGCYPQFFMADSKPTLPADAVGPWAQGCTNAMLQPFLLTAQRPDVVEINGAINCDVDPWKPCPTPKPGARPWTVRVQWSWTTSPTDLQIAGNAQFDFHVEVTSPHRATTTTTTAATTTTAPVR